MNKINRREFLQIIASGVILPQFLFSKSVFAKNNNKFLSECQYVLLEWKKREIMLPLNYLQLRGLGSSIKLSDLNNEDMLNNQFLNVRGLILGKSEAAFLALLAEKNNINVLS